MKINKDILKYRTPTIIKVIAIVIVIVVIICTIWIIYPFHRPPYCEMLEGKLIYQSNISNSSDPEKGIWIEIILKNPEKASLKKGVIVIFNSDNYKNRTSFSFDESENGTPIEKNGYFFEFHDMDGDKNISSHDRIHIYGQKLINKSIRFTISGYCSNITIRMKDRYE